MITRLVKLIVIIIAYATIIYPQDYPHIKKAYIKCYVTHPTEDSLYYYNYTLRNDSTSTGDIFYFEIDISLNPPVLSDTSGLKYRFDFERSDFNETYQGKQGTLVPVGFWCPEDWDGSISYLLVAEISGFPQIKPGAIKSGFQINAKAIPSIRKVTISPAEDYIIDKMPSIEDTVNSLTDQQIDSIKTACKYQTWTIGPHLFPKDYPFSAIIDSIKSYTKRSAMLGWIVDKKDDDKEKHDKEKEKGSEIVKELMKYLDKAREQLVKNKIKEAKKKLEEFVEKVKENYHENDKDEEKEKSEHSYLTSEAYALLKYNAEYLIRQLK